jgi:hypothetical protein
MTEIELHSPREAALTSLALWANDARQAATVAVSLARTPFVPASLRDRDDAVTAANITACILTGQELGMSPMGALRSIDIIQGTPALRAVALRAVVLSAGHDMYLVESTATRAIVRGIRKGSAQEQESVWTMDRARALGLAGKDNWRKQPGAMLVARATGECARLIAADAILGVAYSSEELDDGIEVDAAPDVAPIAVRTARRRTAQPVAIVRPDVPLEANTDAEPDFDEPDSSSNVAAGPQSGADSGVGSRFKSEAAPDTPEESLSDPQLRKIMALFREIEITDRSQRLAIVCRIIGRDIASSNELTITEAGAVITALQDGNYEAAS